MVAILMLPQLVSAAPAQTFTDVPPLHPYYTYIEKLYTNGITIGYGDGTFGPDDPLPRYQTAIMIVKALGAEYQHYEPSFTDVSPVDYYFFYVEEFHRRGITGGCSPGLFCPAGLTSRSQMAIFLVRATGNQAITPTGSIFTDIAITSFGAGFIEGAFQLGITHGCNEAQFCGELMVTRAETAALICRAFGL